MSLQQAITEIEGILDAAPLSLTKHPDLRDAALSNSGGHIHQHYTVKSTGNPLPWIDADGESDLWQEGIVIEVGILQGASTGVQSATITASNIAVEILKQMIYQNLTYCQLWEQESELEESDNYYIWTFRARIRYTGATV